jgi:probable HAF family extracellular repeat protein
MTNQKGGNMESRTFRWITAVALLTALATPVRLAAQDNSAAGEQKPKIRRYVVRDLGALKGGTSSVGYFLNGYGLVSGSAGFADNTQHAVLWLNRLIADLGTLGGSNSIALGDNDRFQAVGEAETFALDPKGEDFCGFGTHLVCLPFLWQHGGMTALPTLGGNNGYAYGINDRGEVAGLAENTTLDSTCPGPPAAQVFQFKPVIWKEGEIQELPTFPGDPDGVAAAINDHGQVVGASGTCAAFNPNSGLNLVENHALLWSNGTRTDLGNLGGTGGLAGNHACALNNRGQVVGHSVLTDSFYGPFHGFLWTRETRMRDLGTLPGDFASLALGINDRGAVVGASLDASFNARAFLWENGVMTDLNTLIPTNSRLYLLFANSINSSGAITGLAVTSSGELHGFLAKPRCDAVGGESASPAS